MGYRKQDCFVNNSAQRIQYEGGDHSKNKCVFKCLLKATGESVSLEASGKIFQSVGLILQNTLKLNCFFLVCSLEALGIMCIVCRRIYPEHEG